MNYFERQELPLPITLLRISIGVIYLWFGVLKFFPHVSPAEDIAKETIQILTFGLIPPGLSIILLAVWETIVGVLVISGFFCRVAMPLVVTHMILTFTPLVLLPQLSFTHLPYALTLVGQYIIKNIVIVSALLVIKSHLKTVE